MTQPVQAPRNLRQPVETPTPWSNNPKLDLVRAIGILANAVEDVAQQENMRAVGALYNRLNEMQKAGRILRFGVCGWKGNELQVNIFMADAAYTRRRRMKIQQDLNASVAELGYFVDATILSDIDDGEPS